MFQRLTLLLFHLHPRTKYGAGSSLPADSAIVAYGYDGRKERGKIPRQINQTF
jgi:hypothetical protein